MGMHPDASDSPHQDKKKASFLSQPLKIKVLMVALTTLLLIVALPLLASRKGVNSDMPEFIIAFAVLLLALFPLTFMVVLSLPKKMLKGWMGIAGPGKDDPRGRGVGGMYNQARRKEELWDRIEFSTSGMIARVGLVLLMGLGLCIFVPRLKRVTLLGSPLWKWSLLSVTLSAGYVQALFDIILFYFFSKHILRQENIVTHYLSVLELQISHVMYTGETLVSWLVYFRTEQGLKPTSTTHPRAFEYVTWTFVSLLIGSVLFLLKGLLLAKWSADVIYRRFEPRILITSLKYFFIGITVVGFFEECIFDDLKGLNLFLDDEDDRSGNDDTDMVSRKFCNDDTDMVSRKFCNDDTDMVSRKLSVTKYIMSRRTQLSHLERVSHILKSLAEIMSPIYILDRGDDEEEEEEVVNWFNNKIKATTDKCTPASLVELFHRIEKQDETANHSSPSTTNVVAEATDTSSGPNGAEPSSQVDGQPVDTSSSPNEAEPSSQADGQPVDTSFGPIGAEKSSQADGQPIDSSEFYPALANVLHRLVREEGSSTASDFTFGDLNMWMVDAHKDCINMGRTLADASAIVSRVDLLISCLIILIVVLLWLMITGFASTTVLVTIATPLLAFTFMFGDTAKTFFQGLIFCFAIHPFDVGDRCILDDTELEVKRVNILTTMFTKIGSKEKRLYPNAVLATKPILNLGWQPDSKDVVELTLNPSTDLEKLKGKITKFFNDQENCSKYKNSCEMMIKELGDSLKVTIHFSHILTIHDLSHNQCLKKKSSQPFDLLNMIKNHINNKSETEEVVHAMPIPDPSRSSQLTTIEMQDMGNMETRTQSV